MTTISGAALCLRLIKKPLANQHLKWAHLAYTREGHLKLTKYAQSHFSLDGSTERGKERERERARESERARERERERDASRQAFNARPFLPGSLPRG